MIIILLTKLISCGGKTMEISTNQFKRCDVVKITGRFG
jgi:hypothetical protein